MQTILLNILENQQQPTNFGIKQKDPYGTISATREPIIKHFNGLKNQGFKEKIKKLNQLLNSKNKNDEFIVTARACTDIFIYIFIKIYTSYLNIFNV